MMASDTIDPRVVSIINDAQAATMDYQVVKTSGAGKAYQSVAQSMAIAVQDAADALRNASTIGTTASGIVIAQMVAGNDANAPALAAVQTMMADAIANFTAIGAASAVILTDFPSG